MPEKRFSNPFFVLLSLPATAMGFALCVQISALSWLLSTQYKLNIEEVGYVWMAGPLAGIFGQVIIGFISDKVWFMGGRRRPFIIIGGTMAALMLLALPNIGTISSRTGLDLIAVAVGVALTLDLAINISFNPTRSIIADVTPAGDNRTRGFTWMQTISGSFGVGAYLLAAKFGNFALIYAGVIIVFLGSVIPPFFIAEPREIEPEEPIEGTQQTQASNNIELLKIYLAHGFCWLGVQTMFVFMFAFIQQKMGAMSDEAIGTVISIAFAVLNTVGFVLPAFVLEPIASRIGRVRTHSLCMGAMAAGYLGISLAARTPTALYLFMIVVGIGWAATVSLPFAILSEKVSRDKMGTFMGIFNLSVVIPQLIVSWRFGRIIEHASDKNIIFLISAASLAASAVAWMTVKESPKS